MNVDLLSKLIKDIVLEEDSISLPGLGTLVAEVEPASFTDKGYTINPPYRRLSFSPRMGRDRLLINHYAETANIEESAAEEELTTFFVEMKEVLKQRKVIILPGLGRLRATMENHFFFVSDENLDIFPAGFGLDSISLKNHDQAPEEIASAISVISDALESTPTEPVVEPATEPEPEPVAEAIEEPIEEPVAEPVAAPVEEPVEDPVATPLAEPAEVPVEEPAATPEPATAPEPVPATVAEPTTVASPSQAATPEPATTPEPVPATVAEPTTAAETTPEPAAAPVAEPAKPQKKPRSGWKRFFTALLVILIIAIVLLVALAVLGRVAPQFVDQYLYSPEELESLRNLSL